MYNATIRKANVEGIFRRWNVIKMERGVYKKKKGIYPRQPIFINIKSNTMKNTVQK